MTPPTGSKRRPHGGYLGLAVVAIVVVTASCVSRPPAGMAWYTAEALGVRFAYPDSFLVGRFAEESLPPAAVAQGIEPPFRNAAVLVRPADLGNHALDAIPVGEIPVIWLDSSPAARLVFRLLQPDTTYRVGDHTVFEFPGFPGPYGDAAFYYVLRFSDGAHLEVAAHRHDMHDPMRPTGFDEIIRMMLPTIEQMIAERAY